MIVSGTEMILCEKISKGHKFFRPVKTHVFGTTMMTMATRTNSNVKIVKHFIFFESIFIVWHFSNTNANIVWIRWFSCGFNVCVCVCVRAIRQIANRTASIIFSQSAIFFHENVSIMEKLFQIEGLKCSILFYAFNMKRRKIKLVKSDDKIIEYIFGKWDIRSGEKYSEK